MLFVCVSDVFCHDVHTYPGDSNPSRAVSICVCVESGLQDKFGQSCIFEFVTYSMSNGAHSDVFDRGLSTPIKQIKAHSCSFVKIRSEKGKKTREGKAFLLLSDWLQHFP